MDNIENIEEIKKTRKISIKKILIILLIIVLIVCSFLLYSRFISTKGLKINEYKIVNTNLTNEYKGLKIVHISDIHYKRVTYENDLEELVNKINLTKPDIIIFTGDLLNKQITYDKKDYETLTKYLSNMEATIGKYAITGDNDYQNNKYANIINESNFNILDDNYELIYKETSNHIVISGISTLNNKINIDEKLNNFSTYLQTEKPIYKILILHEPDLIDKININNYNLVLAGHSIGGNINLPFIGPILKKEGAIKYNKLYYKLNSTDFYISNGIGTDNINYRLFNKPSFNLYRLTNKQ